MGRGRGKVRGRGRVGVGVGVRVVEGWRRGSCVDISRGASLGCS